MAGLDPKVVAWKRAATDDPEKFWGEAAEALPWFKKWERVLEWEAPTFRWYRGGRSDRSAFYRDELSAYLRWCAAEQRDPQTIKGSFAGAMGWPQFMPGSYRKWAVDFDNDQRIDLWGSSADIVGSVASFLSGHGWQRGEPVMLPIAKPSAEIVASIDGGLSPRKTLKEFLAAGVTITARDADVILPADDAMVGVISLDRADGSDEYWLTFENFYVITRYNRSRMYASSVWSLAYALKKNR